MFYNAKLSGLERVALRDLIGRQLDAIRSDGWCVELISGERVLTVEPEDVATPDQIHRDGDVNRPKVLPSAKADLDSVKDTISRELGLIRSVHVISILVSFSEPKPGPAIRLFSGIVIPKGTNYGYIYYSEREKSEAIAQIAPDKALVAQDVGIELVTERNPSVVLYMHGYFVAVSLAGLPRDEDWVHFEVYSREDLT